MKDLIQKFQNSRNVTTALVVILFLLINWISFGFYIRFDLSKEGLFRLSSATKKIIRSLPEEVTIEAFFSTEIPDAQIQQVKNLRDFLKEYANASRGKIQLHFLNPDADEDAKKRAQEQGIQAVQAGVIDEANMNIKNIFLSVLLSYEDKKNVIKNVLETRAMEYSLTTKIHKLVHPTENKVGFLANRGAFALDNQQNPFLSLQMLSQAMEETYGALQSVDITDGDISGEISTLIIATPDELSDSDKFKIDQFILRGGNIILGLGGMSIQFQRAMASPVNNDVTEYFKQYGLAFSKSMILESKNFITFKQPVNMFQRMEYPYPAWVVALEENINQTNPMTKGLPLLFLPWPGSIQPDMTHLKDKDGKNTAKVTILAKSSAQAMNKENFMVIDPKRMKDMLNTGPDAKNNKGQFNLVAVVKGKFNSYFKDKKPPKGSPKSYLKFSDKESTILGIATPFALANFPAGYLRMDSQVTQAIQINMQFILSSLDIMNGFGDLAAARKSRAKDKREVNLDAFEKKLLTMANFFFPILIMAIFGLLHYFKRKRLESEVFSAKGTTKE